MTTDLQQQTGVFTLQKFGLNRQESAAFIGVGVTKFDELVSVNLMPQSRNIGTRKIWCRHELELALISLPANDNVKTNSWES